MLLIHVEEGVGDTVSNIIHDCLCSSCKTICIAVGGEGLDRDEDVSDEPTDDK